ncbi:response regulator [Aquibium sp. A9E412]|uniref:response regulator n=1 Tax=Aquibium sp. A9E412 TaxID=2976767 RepID=UPI0025B07415|nr:response regulator [Aquibium sp. A9E412]MDN2565619.1 response regulator [Aquibium sp. A9E412]
MTQPPPAAGERHVILCVEDEAEFRDDIVEELRACGHAAIGAGDGRAALAMLATVRPDLILCDISMPGMDGYDLMETVRRERADLADVPFVFLTALNDREAVICGKRAGADDYLVKPVDFDLMLASIEARLAQARRVRAHYRRSDAASGAARGRAGDAARPGSAAASGVLDILGFGVVLADARGGVRFANAFARALARDTQSLFVQEALRAATPELTRQLLAHVAEVAGAAAEGGDAMRGMALPLHGTGGELLLVICALPPAGDDGPGAAVFISDTRRRPVPPEHVLGALFGLTPSEAQIAHGLVSGQRSADIARALNVSQTTVAFHLRNLFEKTGTNRQVDFVALVLGTLGALR